MYVIFLFSSFTRNIGIFYFRMAELKMSDIQRVSTFLVIKRNLPDLPNKLNAAMMKELYKELKIQKSDFCLLEQAKEESMVDSFEVLKNRSFTNWIGPPVSRCLDCSSELDKNKSYL